MDRGRKLAVEWEIRTALKGIVRRRERVLVLRRSDGDEIGPGTWEFPGGKIRFGEELEEALLREIEEESGLAVEPGELLYATTFHPAPHRQIVLLSYACYWAGGEVTLSEEHQEARWATREEMGELLPTSIRADLERWDVWDRLGLA